MSTSRILAHKLRCQNCQWRTLSHFAALAGLVISTPMRTTPVFVRESARSFATTYQLRNELRARSDRLLHSRADQTETTTHDEPASSESIDEGALISPSPPTVTASQHDSIPWYLQNQDLNQKDERHVSRQELPDLPANSPERLDAVVKHLFTDIGLDDLRILDLRSMDPPPALGESLIMILGTARSDRHLHVSADRFCRWLRSTYKLQPYADGLIGRNELKIRLRRKAKRAKLMGSKGSTDADADDGIRTGWVCVNVGSIEKQSHVQPRDIEQQGIIGFGGDERSTHLVVQMMVEEKREDLNLEKLWLDALARQERRNLRDQQALEDLKSLQEEDDSTQVRYSGNGYQTSADTMSSHRMSHKALLQSQVRGFHTSRCLSDQTLSWNAQNTAVTSDLATSNTALHPAPVIRMTDRAQIFRNQYRSKLPDGLEKSLCLLTDSSPDQAIDQFRSMLQELPGIYPSALRLSLEKAQDLNANYQLMFKVWIACFAMLLEHPVYDPHSVRAIFETLGRKLHPPLWLHRVAIDAFLPVEGLLDSGPPLDRETSALVLKSLAVCRANDYYILDDSQMFERLFLAKIRSLVDPSTGRIRRDSDFGPNDVKQLLSSIGYSDEVRLSETFHNETLEVLQTARDLEAFFTYWANIPIYSGSRTAAMYEIFLRGILNNGSPVIIRRALDRYIDAMDHETPPVAIEGSIADALVECLKIVDPHIEATSQSDTLGKNYYASLWHRCEIALKQLPRT